MISWGWDVQLWGHVAPVPATACVRFTNLGAWLSLALIARSGVMHRSSDLLRPFAFQMPLLRMYCASRVLVHLLLRSCQRLTAHAVQVIPCLRHVFLFAVYARHRCFVLVRRLCQKMPLASLLHAFRWHNFTLRPLKLRFHLRRTQLRLYLVV
jgi:hypothetical protein